MDRTSAKDFLVLGMGNPILGDDAVGLAVAARLQGRLPGAEVRTSTMAGLALLEDLAGFERIFVIDAMTSRDGHIGALHKISPTEGAGTRHLFSSHGLNFFEIIDLGRCCGYPMPEIGAVYGIEIGAEVAFDSALTHELASQIDTLASTIAADILSACR